MNCFIVVCEERAGADRALPSIGALRRVGAGAAAPVCSTVCRSAPSRSRFSWGPAPPAPGAPRWVTTRLLLAIKIFIIMKYYPYIDIVLTGCAVSVRAC